VQQRKGNRKLKAAWASAAGVQIEHTIAMDDGRLVGVPADNDSNLRGAGIDFEIVERVQHVNETAVELNGLSGGKLSAWAVLVDITSDSSDRRNFAQGIEDVWITYIACVQDSLEWPSVF